jgi:hypothetical protein
LGASEARRKLLKIKRLEAFQSRTGVPSFVMGIPLAKKGNTLTVILKTVCVSGPHGNGLGSI